MRRDEGSLRSLFQRIDSNGNGDITLEDIIRQKDLINRHLPELLAKFSEIDVSGSNTISWPEFKAYFGGNDEWLEFQLSEVVGLESLKDQIRRFARSVMLAEARRKKGFSVESGSEKYHMIFQGNPGTGKTSLGRIISKLLHRCGLTKSSSLVEVQREHLVAEYVGQTSTKTQSVIDEAKDGVLFIDEAYRLSQGGEKDFGKEAIEQLMGAMNDPPGKAPVMVFAGYPDDMSEFMTKNAGLYRRIPYTFDFPDYSCTDLAEILEIIVNKNGYELEDRLTAHSRRRLGVIIERQTLPHARALMNGGLAERIFSFAKQALDARDDPRNPSVILNESDILTACGQIPPPPPREGGSGDAGAVDGEVTQLRSEVRRLQADNSRLQRENAELKAQLSGGGGSSPSAPRPNPSVTPTPGPGAGMGPEPGSASEVYQIKFREWTDLDPDVQQAIRRARRAGQQTATYVARGNEYEADLSTWIQRSLKTGGERQIRVKPVEDTASPDAVTALFSKLDSNNDGVIRRSEMASVLKTYGWSEDDVSRIFAAADSDRDRKITPEEFVKWVFSAGADQKALTEALGVNIF
eukprot:TRINITY_DN7117_c0_g1_i3.p1 TRINITY_DN7117_c0_g1~~TRINITY_DN7117_c0_g1_i3.p1  ORF type:complete len:578 (-),score=94.69 TRINITY_DN7117_c0_g1_i3:50-1783(-)